MGIISLIICSIIPITLEHAVTHEELSRGLMERPSLKSSHGMLFHFPKADYQRIWMFNCQIPLSVAFLDDHGKILEIHQLKAYPHLMQNVNPSHLKQSDPVVQFFLSQSVLSKDKVKYCLEMSQGWFKKNNIQVGDTLEWEEGRSAAHIRK